MVKPSETQRSRTQSNQSAGETDEVRVRLHEAIDGALGSIREQRLMLRQVRDGGYDVALARGQWKRLAGLQGEVEQLLDGATELDASVGGSLQEKSAGVQVLLLGLAEDWGDGAAVDGRGPEKRELRKRLQEVVLQLQVILSDVGEELVALDGADLAVEAKREAVAKLQGAVGQEKQLIAVGDFGVSRKAVFLRQLHRLTLLVYRLRQLVGEPRLQGRLGQLEGVALQVQETVDGLDGEASNVVELLDDSIEVLEYRLSRFEYNRRFLFVPLPFSWFVNRYRDVSRTKSVQGRVLSGLGFSLALSGGTFAVFMMMLTVISAYSSSSGESKRQALKQHYESLVTEVSLLLSQEQEQEALKIQISGINDQIQESRPSGLVSGGSDIPVESVEPEEVADTTGENEEDVLQEAEGENTQLQSLTQMQAELLGKEREAGNLRLSSRAQIERLLEKIRVENEKKDPRDNNRILNLLAGFINDQGLLNHSRRILLAGFAGAIGSMMSILIRLDQMEKEDIKNPFLLGALKPLIGAVFGISVFAILSTRVIDILPSSFYLYEKTSEGEVPVELRGDPLGDLDSQELYKIFLVAFLAGFSERLANDTLRSVGSSRSLG